MITYTTDTIEQLGTGHCGIYIITNSITNRQYVGQSVDIMNRWNQHEYSDAKSELYEDIKKYGLINFKFQILEECSPRVLDEHEYFWINELDTYENGYNNTRGNISVVNKLRDTGDELDVPARSDVERIKNQLDYFIPSRISVYQDYDYIHGTDNPVEIDMLVEQIEHK